MAFHGQVVTKEWPTPGLVRIVIGGPGLDGFTMPQATDTYVNVAIPPAGAPYDAVFEPKVVREEQPQEVWPARRRYTVRAWDEDTRTLTLDFVVHGDEG
ncbi:MAG TPA: siderophore-interacting protein, partial [Nocardioides sp.]|nr:siderophore-interacting protein [Nocardioides sp.]